MGQSGEFANMSGNIRILIMAAESARHYAPAYYKTAFVPRRVGVRCAGRKRAASHLSQLEHHDPESKNLNANHSDAFAHVVMSQRGPVGIDVYNVRPTYDSRACDLRCSQLPLIEY